MPHDVLAAIGSYFHEMFVGRFDFWLMFGVGGQLLFAGRFLVQWIQSEREGRSVVPVAFWVLSVVGGTMTLIYGIVRHEPIIILGQALSNVVYVRNLMLIARSKRGLTRDKA